MKKINLLFIGVLIILISACGGNSNNQNNDSQDDSTSTANDMTTNSVEKTNEIEFSFPTFEAEGPVAIDIDNETVFDIGSPKFKLYYYDFSLYLLDQEYNAFFISNEMYMASEYNTEFSSETKTIDGKELLFIKWSYGDGRSGFMDGYEEAYSGVQVWDTENLVCLADFIYDSHYLYYEATEEMDEDEHAKASENSYFEQNNYTYEFKITNSGFELNNFEASVSTTDNSLIGTWSDVSTYPEGSYTLKNGKFVCSTKIPYEEATHGLFAVASIRKLTEDEVKNCDKAQLKVMRNEIYARHGYKFKTETMLDYFAECNWYSGIETNVDSKLTKIEKENIELIQKYEK